ncbi:hypothetical protein HW49_03000 [Porphyromonadaceae bacterium COT-184 OH4590]|nr:hypothetical protein HW49_03000 [Porphyromonadaceae bacterium COT-184 OH4590]MDO4726553.1 hypothetical protein [Porphyromonadaceae bacterium]
MINESRQIIERAKEKIRQLEEQNRSLREELSELSIVREKYQDLLSDYERLKLAKAFGHSEEDKQRAYRRLTNMIAEIDKCLEMLND